MSFHIHFHFPKDLNNQKSYKSIAWEKFLRFLQKDQSAFTTLPSSEELEQIKDMNKKFSHKKTLIHIGIGGSSLGTKTIIKALAPKASIIFMENITSENQELLREVNINETLFHIVSKSGNTTEVLTHLKLITQTLKNHHISEDDYQDYFVMTSSGLSGEINQFQKKHQLSELFIPKMLGGRFSVLSPVGLFPAHFFNLKIENLVAGAKKAERFLHEDHHILQKIATAIHHFYQKQIDQHVLMPYEEKLTEFTYWFCQLWGESLGKKTLEGDHIGITPIASLGSRDQHSLLQLYLHGPLNKLIIFMSVLENNNQFSHINEALQKGCQLALADQSRPYCHIELARLDEETLGELFQFFHYLVVYLSQLFNINPYDQPAVEIAKNFTKKQLSLKD